MPFATQAINVKTKPTIIRVWALLIANAKKIMVPVANDMLAHRFAIAIMDNIVSVCFILKCFVFQSNNSKKMAFA